MTAATSGAGVSNWLRFDDWVATQDDDPGRSEAIRRLVELGLKAKSAR